MTAKIALIGTGGTIASTATPDRDVALPSLTPDELLGRLELSGDMDIEPIDLYHEGSNTLSVKHVLHIADTVKSKLSQGADAAVITQGTATLAETAYLYDLLLGDGPPVVCTGAMKPASDLTPDGPGNLRDSIAFAASSVGSRRGVYVVIDGGIHAPIDVLKVHAATAAGFTSPGVGVLGWVDAGEVRVRRERKIRSRVFQGLERGVELLVAAFDSSPLLAECAADADVVRGLVVAGFPGRGAVPPDWMAPLQRFAESGRPILFTASSLTGRVVAKHGAKATARHVRALGAVIGGDLAPTKARCLLMAILSETEKVEEIEELVREELECS